jgi:hypothetical protein
MYYANRKILLASKHEKEKAIAKAFAARFSCTLDVHDFDTDKFGTFTGEISRKLSPYDTCVLKAKTAAENYDYDLSIASEGSFGPHPAFPFIPIDNEIMVFIDRKNNWIIAEEITSSKTNYDMITINPKSEIESFLDKVGFPEHALTIQTNTNKLVISKGIRDKKLLDKAIQHGFKYEKELFIATDMRAMMNPTRMELITELADKLSSRIATICPSCTCPGFGLCSTIGSLPCASCGANTNFYEGEIWGCINCSHKDFKKRRDGLLTADPSYCNYCNP